MPKAPIYKNRYFSGYKDDVGFSRKIVMETIAKTFIPTSLPEDHFRLCIFPLTFDMSTYWGSLRYVAHTTGKNRTLAVTAAAERVGPESGVIKPLVRHPGPM